ncbi:MAG: carboxymuconolactone decarboxylase family protein [Acidimicrobiales bacterium]
MPHIDLPEGVPGVRSLFEYRPETALPLLELVETLLRGPSTLSPGERELIASYVSRLNACRFCEATHSAFAAVQLDDDWELVESVKADPDAAAVTDKLKALLAIAAKVQQGGLAVTESDVAAAKDAGATDVEIHDTVLIAATFCMFNRYVDGLATWTPSSDPQAYLPRARALAADGYLSRPNNSDYLAK